MYYPEIELCHFSHVLRELEDQRHAEEVAQKLREVSRLLLATKYFGRYKMWQF